MANKRALKQSINLFSEELLAECMAAALYCDTCKGNADAMLFSVIRMQDDFIRRISHVEPGMPAKKYFNQLKEDFAVQASEIIDQINNQS